MKYVIALCLFGLTYAGNQFCQLEPDAGPCKAFFPSYYYDAEIHECREFIYGGCQGNENRFKTEDECEETCGENLSVQKSNEAICHLEPEKGMCLAYMPRYYYNDKEGKCMRFIYGGCQGNPNNFKTLEECETRCATQRSDVPVCDQEPETGLCRGYFPRYYYDKETGKCSVFVYGGCGGNQNNFETEEECLQKCNVHQTSVPVCEQEARPGRCLAYMPRYYYDKTSGQCKRFIYGGCDGNENNFKTREECEDTCQVVEAESVCELEAETGPCRAYFVRYYFNKDSGKCETFVYGGCQGNGNNFKTEEECHQTCSAQSAVSVCEQERQTGPCRGYFPRYYYNKESGSCERFIYGGCQANDNNFNTVEECQQTCGDY